MPNETAPKERTIGILIFDDAEELDFVGPYEVFTMSNEMYAHGGKERLDKVVLISETGKTVTCAKGMRVEAHHSWPMRRSSTCCWCRAAWVRGAR
jgi:transcriptional regulator GlxA family with amidase domain